MAKPKKKRGQPKKSDKGVEYRDQKVQLRLTKSLQKKIDKDNVTKKPRATFITDKLEEIY